MACTNNGRPGATRGLSPPSGRAQRRTNSLLRAGPGSGAGCGAATCPRRGVR
ncbi:hypothetical protein ACMZ5A_28990 [Bacillus mobilis]|uniref:hypothetical protein n=1 Tax=Bacillus mobilis TaxID=2026190 RepID=UPI0039F0CB8E